MDSISVTSTLDSADTVCRSRCGSLFSRHEIQALKKQGESAQCSYYKLLNEIIRSIDCATCQEPCAFEIREKPGYLFCGPACVTAATKKLACDQYRVNSSGPATPLLGHDAASWNQWNKTKNTEKLDEQNSSDASRPRDKSPVVELTLRGGLSTFLASGKGRENDTKRIFKPQAIPPEMEEPYLVRPSSSPANRSSRGSPNWPSQKWLADADLCRVKNRTFIEQTGTDLDALEAKSPWTMKDLQVSWKFTEGARVWVTYTWEPAVVTMQAMDDMDQLEQMQADIQSYCVTAPELQQVPRVNDVVFVKYDFDNKWYRASVENVDLISQPPTLTINFFDYGGVMDVPMSWCREPCTKIMKANSVIYGMKYTLDIDSVDLPPDYPSPANVIIPLLDHQVFRIRVLSNSRLAHPNFGDLLREDGTSILDPDHHSEIHEPLEKIDEVSEGRKSDYMDKKGDSKVNLSKDYEPDVKYVKVRPLRIHSTNTNLKSGFGKIKTEITKTEKQAKPYDSKSETRSDTSKPENTKPVQVQPSAKPKKMPTFRFSGMALSSNFRQNAKVKVAFFEKLGHVYITAEKDGKQIDLLEDLISKYIPTAPKIKGTLTIDDMVVAPCSPGNYCRARVLEVRYDKVKLEYIDHGDSRTLPTADCYQISTELFNIPILGVKVNIIGIPADAIISGAAEIYLSVPWELDVIEKPEYTTWKCQLWRDDGKSYTEIAKRHIAKQKLNRPVPIL